MRKIFLIVVLIISIFLIGCSQPILVEPIPEPIIEYVEVENTDRIDELELEVKKYQALIGNLNSLLSNVYYVYQGKDDGSSVWGTGFSIEYQGNYYFITAGHAIENEYGVFKNLGFKDINDNWIYPELLTYEVTKTTPDYAIFYSDKITNGLNYDLENSEPDYRLGIDIQIQENNTWGISGECGSPIIDLDGEVTGIHVGYLSDIDTVLRAIDDLK